MLGAGGTALALAGWPTCCAGGRQGGGRRDRQVHRRQGAEKGKITIELPEIAENGNTVPLSVTVECSDDERQLRQRHSGGGRRQSASGRRAVPLHAAVRQGDASTRIRLAATQNIIVVAKTSDGQFFTDQKLVKVTIGGCGG